MKTLVIDNYDSFTYNLVQYLGELDARPTVFRNDELTVEEAVQLDPSHLVISPGPGRPEEGGKSAELVCHFAGKIPILGVCLGHQIIGQIYGGQVGRAPQPVHGKSASVFHNEDRLFQGVPNPFQGTRYHSLLVDKACLPADFILTGWTEDGLVMAFRHRNDPIFGVQFHPESVMTEEGHKILKNFLCCQT